MINSPYESEGGGGDAAHQVVAGGRTADGGRHVADLRTALQVGPDLFQVRSHPCGVRALGQLVLHVELVVLHVGEESVVHVLVAPRAQGDEDDGDEDGRNPVAQPEVQGGAQPAVHTAAV